MVVRFIIRNCMDVENVKKSRADKVTFESGDDRSYTLSVPDGLLQGLSANDVLSVNAGDHASLPFKVIGDKGIYNLTIHAKPGYQPCSGIVKTSNPGQIIVDD